MDQSDRRSSVGERTIRAQRRAGTAYKASDSEVTGDPSELEVEKDEGC